MNLNATQMAQLQLIRTDGIGPVSYFGLLNRYGSPEAALDALPGLKRGAKIATEKAIEQEVTALARWGGKLVFFNDPAYPAALRHIPDPPPVLAVLGDETLLTRPQVAIVGNRNASAAGVRFTHTLARDLARSGWVVTSGMARGIDTAAHQGCLEGGQPTIAVLGGGLDHIYPRENEKLYARIAQEGLVITEAPFGCEPTAALFPRRNRIIAGLSLGLIVTEAARHSGSLITARMAGDYGREVFAVPGHPTEPRSQGPNHLLRQGAILLESAQDALDHLAAQAEPQMADLFAQRRVQYIKEDDASINLEPQQPPQTGGLLDLLSATPITIDELVRQCGQTAQMVTSQLMELELDGLIEHLPGGRIVKI